MTDDSWKGPVAKLKTQTEVIASSWASHGVAAAIYNARALPALGYVAQLIGPPANFRMTEMHIGNKILRLPGSCLPAEAAQFWHAVGGSYIRSGAAFVASTAIRAASCTVTTWKKVVQLIEKQSMCDNSDIPLARTVQGRPWASHWLSEPICFFLRRAAAGVHPLTEHTPAVTAEIAKAIKVRKVDLKQRE